jgi:hypothetical protein
MKTDGYLVFTTHDRDELDATFFPLEGNSDLLDKLQKVYPTDANDIYLEAWNEWIVTPGNGNPVTWSTQSRCKEPWPFNNYNILGTFYLLVY